MKKRILFFSLLVLTLVYPLVSAAPITAVTNKIIYAWGDTMTITGTIDTASNATLTATIYNSTGSVMNVSSVSSSGSSPNTFSIANAINNSYSSGNCLIVITDGTDTVNMSFRVVSQRITLEAPLINATGDVINVSTTNSITISDWGGGNFTDVLNLSKSTPQKVYYGNYSIDGKLYHFVLVDQTNTSNYNRLYVDDDTHFRLWNDTEDSGGGADVEYQELKTGSKFSNGTFTYIVGEMERGTSNKILLWKTPAGKPPYNITDTVSFVVLAKNSTHLLSGQGVKVDVLNSTGNNITPTTTRTTNDFGWFNTSVPLNNVRSGFYIISLNDSLGIGGFVVEAFKLFASTTDLSNTPTLTFAPNAPVRIKIAAKDSAGDPKNLTSPSAEVFYPNGTTQRVSAGSFDWVTDGVYRHDLNLQGGPAGSYAVKITGTIDSDSQEQTIGFDIRSVKLESMAINVKYADEAESEGAMVSAFAPNTNITIITVLSNISAGGIFGPKGSTEGLIRPTDCSASLSLTEITDENGVSYAVSYISKNVSDALTDLGFSDVHPPPGITSQCMLFFPAINKTGIYNAKVQFDYQGEVLTSGVTFGIQRLLARASTVDFRGDDFGFFAPNTTVRIKLKVRDLVTDQELPATNITGGKIIEMEKMFPVFKDILGNSSLRNNLNETITNGTISFLAPNEEGFFEMRFRYTADVSGISETGIGDAFFVLKKYMVWGELSGAEAGNWFVKQGENVTLQVTVIDIDKAQNAFSYGGSASCTGCTGLVVNVSALRNEQQFEEITDYSVITGVISSESNPVTNIIIEPSPSMKPGWYSVDLELTDPTTNSTYFGWGWFEIRNFFVDTRAVEFNGTDYILTEWQEGPSSASYAVGQPAYFAIIPTEPLVWEFLTPTEAPTVESMNWFVCWPPVEISDYSVTINSTNVIACREGRCQEKSGVYVANLTGLPPDKQGRFRANVKVNVNGTIDTGSFEFDVAPYRVTTVYRQKSFPPLFASTENLTINFTGLNFEPPWPHNLTNVTIDEFFSEKMGRPIKFTYGQNYSTDCTDNLCTMGINLSTLTEGRYFVQFEIIDEDNETKSSEIYFELRNLVVSIPTIEEVWQEETDVVNKKLDNDVRRSQWSWCNEEEKNSIPNAKKLRNDFCQEGGCTVYNLTAPNVSYSKEVFGYIPLMEDWAVGRFGSLANKSRMWMYANGSHMWINATPKMVNESEYWRDLRETTPIAVNGTFTDSRGGRWRLDAVGDQSITITGLNTLYKTGVFIDTSLSKSGVFKIGRIRENELGAYTQRGRTGVDLDGDGNTTSGTFYWATADGAISGVYDTFFFSLNGNFTGDVSSSRLNPIFVNDTNSTNRTFGFGTQANWLTVLSIDPRGRRARLYSRQVGDWANLGDIKNNSNISIPVIVSSPDMVTPQTANVSITGYKNTRTGVFTSINLITKEITGAGEVSINSSDITGLGEFTFRVEYQQGSSTNALEEWKWPRATIRTFLVDGEAGDGAYLTNFQPLDLRGYRWDSPGVKIIRIQQDRRNTTSIVDGVLAHASPFDFGCGPEGECCRIYLGGNDITAQVDWNYTPILKEENSDQNNYYFYINTSAGGVRHLYKNITGCDFNITALSGGLLEGNYTSIIREGRTFNVSMLKIDTYNTTGECGSVYCWRADFGVPGVNASVIEPMVNNPYADPNWRIEWGYMQNVSIFGSYYDVILANDTTYNYTRCIFERQSDGQCAKKAWIVPTSIGNFSKPETKNVTIGQNFTTDLYLAGIGPNDGDGITVGNFLALETLGFNPPGLPGITGMNLADNTVSYFNVLDEATLIVDLDKDGGMNRTFYAFVFDNNFDGQGNLTNSIFDDDLQIVDWSVSVGGSDVYIDFNSTETYNGASFDNITRTRERWEGLPSGVENGCARFGEDYNITDYPWEFQPSWDVPFYNTTHMLIRKGGWRARSPQNITIVTKVYNFDQTVIPDVNISVDKIMRMSPFGFVQLTNPTHYGIDSDHTINATDANGYSLIKIMPNTTTGWGDGEYQIVLTAHGTTGSETFDKWFCVGGSCG